MLFQLLAATLSREYTNQGQSTLPKINATHIIYVHCNCLRATYMPKERGQWFSLLIIVVYVYR